MKRGIKRWVWTYIWKDNY